MYTRIYIILAIIAVCSTATDGSPLGWGTWLGADWRTGESRLNFACAHHVLTGLFSLFCTALTYLILCYCLISLIYIVAENMRNALSIDIKNIQTSCKDDVNKQCNNDSSPITAQSNAYTQWTNQYKRHMYKRWDNVPYGFGNLGSDQCLRFHRHNVSSKCKEWLNKAEAQFERLQTREKGNDKREIFVIFSTIFATAVSAAVGYMFGLFVKERDDVFAWNNRRENKKIILYFCIAISLPALVILWASPKLLLLMIGSFGIGRAVQLYRQKREDEGYSGLSGDESGLVFAAIPVS